MNDQFRFDGSPMPPDPDRKAKKKDGYAVASLVLGIVALLFSCPCCCCLYPVAGICAILAIVFSAISLKRRGKSGIAIAGLILGIVALVIVLVVIISIAATPDVPDLPEDGADDQAYIDWVYRMIEKYAGKETADQWYDAVMGTVQE